MSEDKTIKQCADTLSDLGCEKSGEQLALFSNFLAIAISKDKSSDQLNVLGNFISAVGAIVSAMASQRQICESKQDKLKQIGDLKKQIKALEDSIKGC
jgi:hypothetical protein